MNTPFGVNMSHCETAIDGNCLYDCFYLSNLVPDASSRQDCRNILFNRIEGNFDLYYKVYKHVLQNPPHTVVDFRRWKAIESQDGV